MASRSSCTTSARDDETLPWRQALLQRRSCGNALAQLAGEHPRRFGLARRQRSRIIAVHAIAMPPACDLTVAAMLQPDADLYSELRPSGRVTPAQVYSRL
jgi:hypothetical protein